MEQTKKLNMTAMSDKTNSNMTAKKEAMKLVAKDRGVGKREIYQQLLEEE